LARMEVSFRGRRGRKTLVVDENSSSLCSQAAALAVKIVLAML
jgi:hypothetical protein